MFFENEQINQLNSHRETQAIYRSCDFGPMWFDPSIQVDSAFLDCDFIEVEFPQNDFIMSLFYKCRFEGCVFKGAAFRDCRFLDCVFNNCTFTTGEGNGKACLTEGTKWYGCTRSNCQGWEESW